MASDLTIREQSTAVVVPAAVDMSGGVFSSPAAFDAGQRMAKALAMSEIVPAAYKGNMANCVVALDMAMRMKLSPLVVLTNLNIIHGRPSWSSTFVISAINSSGLFSPLRFEFRGAEGTDEWACRAKATDLEQRSECLGPWISVGMAKREGWYTRTGSKWPTMTETMLMYRAAAFFGRMFAAHILSGMQTAEEVEDVVATVPAREVEIVPPAAASAAARLEEKAARKPRQARQPAAPESAAPATEGAAQTVTADGDAGGSSGEPAPGEVGSVVDADFG
jgi:hypothetical protein